MKKNKGFTLVELSVVIGILAVLLGFTTINLVGSQQAASLTSAEEVLLADLKHQQLKSMIGDTEGRATSDSYGIHFDSNQYVLFHGAYLVGEPSNFAINLDSNMQFNTPGFNIVFEKVTGETAPIIIELQDNPSSKLKRIHLNIFGTVIEVESL